MNGANCSSPTQFLVLSRDGTGLGVDATNPVMFKSILLVDLNGATNILGQFDAPGDLLTTSPGVLKPTITPLQWAEALNMLNTADLAKFNIDLAAPPGPLTISEKWEALALAPALDPDHPNDYFLFVANDNDFSAYEGYMSDIYGVPMAYSSVDDAEMQNDTMFLAYRVSIIPTPEPMTGMLTGLGLAAASLAALRRRRA